MIFVQWYKVMEDCTFLIDANDGALQFVRLRWQRTTGLAGVISSAAEYGLVTLEFAGGFVNINLRTFLHKLLNETS